MKRVVIVVCVLLLCAGSFGDGVAQELGFKGIGGRLSFVDPEGGIGSTVGFGAHADLGQIIPNLRLVPSIEYWSKSIVSQVAINGDVRYYFPTQGKVDFFAGGGLVIAFKSIGPIDDSDVGIDLLGGIDFPVSPNLVGTVELKFLASPLEALKITGGITYLLR